MRQWAEQSPGGRLHERCLAHAVVGHHEGEAVGELQRHVVEGAPALNAQASDHAAARTMRAVSRSRSRWDSWAKTRTTRSTNADSRPTRSLYARRFSPRYD